MISGTFMDIVATHYDKIKSIFKSRLHNMGIPFDEDALNDAFIKCAQRFGNTNVEYTVVIKYYWVAYLNTLKSNKNKLECVSLDIEMHDCIETDNTEIINIYNTIMDIISEKFSETDMMIYSLYKFHNWSKSDLEQSGYDTNNLESRIKEIHKFIKTYCKKHMKSQ
jgi:hypothetical protein